MIADRYIYATLIANAGVSALAGNRVYPVTIPQDAIYPAIAYSATYSPADDSKNEAATHDSCQFTLVAWAAEYDDAADLDVAIRAALDYRDSQTAGGVTVDSIDWQSSQDGIGEGNTASGGKPYFFRASTYYLREQL